MMIFFSIKKNYYPNYILLLCGILIKKKVKEKIRVKFGLVIFFRDMKEKRKILKKKKKKY